MKRIVRLGEIAQSMVIAALNEAGDYNETMSLTVKIPDLPDRVCELRDLETIIVNVVVGQRGKLLYDAVCMVNIFEDTGIVNLEHFNEVECLNAPEYVETFAYYNGQAEKIHVPFCMQKLHSHVLKSVNCSAHDQCCLEDSHPVTALNETETGVVWQTSIPEEVLEICEA